MFEFKKKDYAVWKGIEYNLDNRDDLDTLIQRLSLHRSINCFCGKKFDNFTEMIKFITENYPISVEKFLNEFNGNEKKIFSYHLPKMGDKLKESYVISRLCNYIEENGGKVEKTYYAESSIANQIIYTSNERILTENVVRDIFTFDDDKEIVIKMTI